MMTFFLVFREIHYIVDGRCRPMYLLLWLSALMVSMSEFHAVDPWVIIGVVGNVIETAIGFLVLGILLLLQLAGLIPNPWPWVM